MYLVTVVAVLSIPELLSEMRAQVLSQLAVVLQTGQQEVEALEQQDGLNRTGDRHLQARQNQHHLLDLVTNEGELRGWRGSAFELFLSF